MQSMASRFGGDKGVLEWLSFNDNDDEIRLGRD